jgi:hypothetical protein
MTAVARPKAATINASAHDGVGRLPPVMGADNRCRQRAHRKLDDGHSSDVDGPDESSDEQDLAGDGHGAQQGDDLTNAQLHAGCGDAGEHEQSAKAQAMLAQPPALGAGRVSAHCPRRLNVRFWLHRFPPWWWLSADGQQGALTRCGNTR